MRFTPEYKYDTEELDKLISGGEGVHLDFKQTISSKQKIARTLAAFANNRGGKLLVGVKDNGDLIGCDTEQEMYMIYEAAEHLCNPPVDVEFSIYETEEMLTVLVADVRNSLRKPHFAQDDHHDWQLYMRSKDKTMVASKNTHKVLEREQYQDDEAGNQLNSKEQFVLEFLASNSELMAKELSRRLNISLQRANNILTKLTFSGLIIHHKDARGDYYTLR
jgi:predicted HTH transcriptional regulator